MPEIVTIETSGLGDRSYLVHDHSVAVVIDPQRDIDRVTGAADQAGVQITHVLETHIHNDYVTGGLALAQVVGAEYVVAAGDQVGFSRTAAGDGDQFGAGSMTISVVTTPGHTPTHLSYVLREDGTEPVAVFTGGSLLFGAVGRTDLISPEQTESLTRAQYRSVRRLADELPDQVAVYPTHGFGSFCSATPTSGDYSTIGRERQSNVALRSGDEDSFVKELMAGLGAHPRYYTYMGPINRSGPGLPHLSIPQTAEPHEIRRRIEAGEWVVDLRSRRAFARNHVSGTISFELGDPFATYLGWTIPWEVPLTLIGEHPQQVVDAQRQLARIGIDRLSGATGTVGDLADGRTSSYEVAQFEDLAAHWAERDLVVLDVRRPDEWATGHLAGAVHIPFWELEQRMEEVPDGTVWVHCASGFRAAIGASLLDRAGRRAVHIDDDWERAGQLGLPVTKDS
jgi:hydroxyacylglutathione hydrolase